MALPYSLFPPVPVLPPPCVLLLLPFCLIHPFLPPSFSYTVRGLVRLNFDMKVGLHVTPISGHVSCYPWISVPSTTKLRTSSQPVNNQFSYHSSNASVIRLRRCSRYRSLLPSSPLMTPEQGTFNKFKSCFSPSQVRSPNYRSPSGNCAASCCGWLPEAPAVTTAGVERIDKRK
jgi:hypothetical protein